MKTSFSAFGTSWIQSRIIAPVRSQLLQGATPESLALACALGVLIGTFPLLGTTTTLCLMVGAWLKLNQPVLQLINYLLYPLQLLGIPFFAYYGSVLTRSPPVRLTPQMIAAEFGKGIPEFFRHFGWIGFHAVIAWAVLMLPVALLIRVGTRPLFKRWQLKLQKVAGL